MASSPEGARSPEGAQSPLGARSPEGARSLDGARSPKGAEESSISPKDAGASRSQEEPRNPEGPHSLGVRSSEGDGSPEEPNGVMMEAKVVRSKEKEVGANLENRIEEEENKSDDNLPDKGELLKETTTELGDNKKNQQSQVRPHLCTQYNSRMGGCIVDHFCMFFHNNVNIRFIRKRFLGLFTQ